MHLGNRRARQGGLIKSGKERLQRLAKRALYLSHCQFRSKRRHLVLELCQLVSDVERQQVAPRRQHLAELDEDRAERLERLAQAPTASTGCGRKVVQPVARADGKDARETEQPT